MTLKKRLTFIVQSKENDFCIMRSIVRSTSEKLLLTINIPREQAAILSDIMTAHGGRLITAARDDGNEQLGFLLGFSGFKATEKNKCEVAQSCVVFSGISPSELNIILNDMRTAGASVTLKAICTAHNQSWTLCELACELEKEHKAMNGGGMR